MCCLSEWTALGPADLPRLLQGQRGGQAQAGLTVRLPLQSHSVSPIPYVRSSYTQAKKRVKEKKNSNFYSKTSNSLFSDFLLPEITAFLIFPVYFPEYPAPQGTVKVQSECSFAKKNLHYLQ
jgi:hypothetical protein